MTGVAAGVSIPAAAEAADAAARRAAASNAALERFFAVKHGLYAETYPKTAGNAYSYEWPLLAGIDRGDRPRRYAVGKKYAKIARARFKALEHDWNPTPVQGPPHYASYVVPPPGQGGDAFYDDNEWDALAKLQWHYQTGDRDALRRAQQIRCRRGGRVRGPRMRRVR